jgi:prepilin-type N-terminal cleavage/methylation domain-containing protein
MRLAPPGANPQRAAFTLLEVLAVVALIAVLTGIVIGVGRRAIEASRATRARAELAVLASALESYKRVYGDYPRTDDAAQLLRALLGQRGPASEAEINGRALLETARFRISEGMLVDPWDQPYEYAYKIPAAGWANVRFVLYSRGPDRGAFSRLLAGGFVDATAPANQDNIHANP